MKRVLATLLMICLVLPMFAQAAGGSSTTSANPIYTKERWLRTEGDKSKEVKVRMHFEEEILVVQDKKKGHKLFQLAYESIDGLTYSKSKSPRWKSGIVAVALAGPLAAPIFLLKGSKHWLTVSHGGEMTAFRLDKKTYNQVVREFEAKTGLRAEWVED